MIAQVNLFQLVLEFDLVEVLLEQDKEDKAIPLPIRFKWFTAVFIACVTFPGKVACLSISLARVRPVRARMHVSPVYSMFRLFWPGGALTCFGMFACKVQLYDSGGRPTCL